jgi:hypothetical protein
LKVWSVPPSSTSSADRHRVVALQQRIEQLEHADRRGAGPAAREVVALEDLRDRGGARQPQELVHPHVQPLGVEAQLVELGIVAQDTEGLLLVGAGVGVDLLPREDGPRARPPARVAHARREVAHDQHDAMAEVLELAQLGQHDRVAEVDVRRGRVEPELHAQSTSLALGFGELALEASGG